MTGFGSYEVLYELRSGGMGKVLLACRRGPGGFEKLVAIKTIRSDLAAASQIRAMFLDEAAILARLNHPAVATVHDFGDIDGALYLVMEYVAGVPLHNIIGHRPPPITAAQILVQACRGIHAAHELKDLGGQLLGVVHRDISPDNVLIDFDGHVKVIDFGIALVKGRQAKVTELGMLKGKPPYMSPEQIKSEAIDRRSDIFALSVVLWELLTGQALFEGDSLYAIARAVEDQPIAAPSTIAGPLPPGLDAVVLRGLARDPQLRFDTAADMADELEAIIGTTSGESLQAYCARTLAEQRESHREWLATILGGAPPAPMGRPTGATTAVAQLPTEPADGPDPVEALVPGDRLRRRSVVVAAASVGLAALAAIGWQVSRSTSGHSNSNAAVALPDGDTPVAEAIQRDQPQRDERDAGFDAGSVSLTADVATARPVRRDTGRDRSGADARNRPHRRDPAPAMALPIEPTESGPAAIGYLKVTAHPFAYVSIDDGSAVSTPILKSALPVGSHRVVLTDPSSGNPLLERTVTIAADQLTTVSLP